MKKIFYLVALASVFLFGISVFNLTRIDNLPAYLDIKIHGKGFNASTSDPKHDAVKDKLLDCIKTNRLEAEKNQKWYFWLNFTVTVLTAGSTLVSSFKAAKDSPPTPQAPGSLNKFAVAIAILTFLSTLANFGATQLNDRKNNAVKSLATATQDLNDFYRKYDTAKTDAERDLVNREYDQKICVQ